MNTHNNDETVVLKVYDDLGAATMAQSRLTDQGIYSSIHDDNVLGMDPVAGIELKIFAKDADKAKRVLAIQQ